MFNITKHEENYILNIFSNKAISPSYSRSQKQKEFMREYNELFSKINKSQSPIFRSTNNSQKASKFPLFKNNSQIINQKYSSNKSNNINNYNKIYSNMTNNYTSNDFDFLHKSTGNTRKQFKALIQQEFGNSKIFNDKDKMAGIVFNNYQLQPANHKVKGRNSSQEIYQPKISEKIHFEHIDNHFDNHKNRNNKINYAVNSVNKNFEKGYDNIDLTGAETTRDCNYKLNNTKKMFNFPISPGLAKKSNFINHISSGSNIYSNKPNNLNGKDISSRNGIANLIQNKTHTKLSKQNSYTSFNPKGQLKKSGSNLELKENDLNNFQEFKKLKFPSNGTDTNSVLFKKLIMYNKIDGSFLKNININQNKNKSSGNSTAKIRMIKSNNDTANNSCVTNLSSGNFITNLSNLTQNEIDKIKQLKPMAIKKINRQSHAGTIGKNEKSNGRGTDTKMSNNDTEEVNLYCPNFESEKSNTTNICSINNNAANFAAFNNSNCVSNNISKNNSKNISFNIGNPKHKNEFNGLMSESRKNNFLEKKTTFTPEELHFKAVVEVQEIHKLNKIFQ